MRSMQVNLRSGYECGESIAQRLIITKFESLYIRQAWSWMGSVNDLLQKLVSEGGFGDCLDLVLYHIMLINAN